MSDTTKPKPCPCERLRAALVELLDAAVPFTLAEFAPDGVASDIAAWCRRDEQSVAKAVNRLSRASFAVRAILAANANRA